MKNRIVISKHTGGQARTLHSTVLPKLGIPRYIVEERILLMNQEFLFIDIIIAFGYLLKRLNILQEKDGEVISKIIF
jgi:hypothetical protein